MTSETQRCDYVIRCRNQNLTLLQRRVPAGLVWYHLYNLKNVQNTHGEVLLLVKLQASVFGHGRTS